MESGGDFSTILKVVASLSLLLFLLLRLGVSLALSDTCQPHFDIYNLRRETFALSTYTIPSRSHFALQPFVYLCDRYGSTGDFIPQV